jgi:hypothetical protein
MFNTNFLIMRKICFTLLAMMLATVGVMAQAQVGIRGGLNLASISDDFNVQEADQPWRLGINLGISSQFRVGEAFSLAPELIYEQRGYRVETASGGHADATFNYLSMPLMFRLHFGSDVLQGYVNAGPVFSYWLGGHQTSTVPGLFDVNFDRERIVFEKDDGPWAYSDASRLEFAGGIGGGILLDTEGGTFLIDLRYIHGFTEVATVPYLSSFKNRVLSISLAYLIPSVRSTVTVPRH